MLAYYVGMYDIWLFMKHHSEHHEASYKEEAYT